MPQPAWHLAEKPSIIAHKRNTNEISEICHARQEPIFITKNGYGDLVVMSIETYEKMVETAETNTQCSQNQSSVNSNNSSTAT